MSPSAGAGGLACLLNLLVLLVAAAMTAWIIRGASASDPDGSLLRQSLRRRLFRAVARFSRDPADAWYGWGLREAGPATARACFEEAARLGHASACLRLAERLPAGALRAHPEEALRWYRRAAELGSAEGAYRTGLELSWRAEAAEESRHYLEQAAAFGHRAAQDRLAGRIPAPPLQEPLKDPQKPSAQRLTERLLPLAPWILLFLALSLGLIFLVFFLSFILAMGALAPTMFWMLLPGPVAILAVWLTLRGGFSPGRASRHTRRLIDRAAQGNADALFELGSHYMNGGGGHPKDLLEARRCFLQAAHAGHPAAMFELADLLQWGAGGPRDPEGAQRWLERSAAQGHPSAKTRLAQAASR